MQIYTTLGQQDGKRQIFIFLCYKKNLIWTQEAQIERTVESGNNSNRGKHTFVLGNVKDKDENPRRTTASLSTCRKTRNWNNMKTSGLLILMQNCVTITSKFSEK